jgi:hypothetical protein
LTDQQAALELVRLVALVHDGHTRLIPGGKPFRLDRWYPVRIDRFADGFFVIATSPAHEPLVGAEVIRIGGRPVEQVWSALADLSSGDNEFSKLSGVPQFLMMPEIVTTLGLTGAAGLELEVRVSGATRRVTVPPIPGNRDFLHQVRDRVAGDSTIGLPAVGVGPPDLPFRWPDDPYWFRHERETGVLYARINQVLDSDRPIHLDDDTARMRLAEFGQRVLARIDSGAVRTLVIDLRNNGGGNNFLIVPFVQALSARPTINNHGRLFVITGRRTYSAAMNFTSLLEERTAAIFVGEPPGGAPSHYGDATRFQLPNSDLRLLVSTLHWDLGVRPTDLREVHEPDLPVAPRFADLRSGKDGALAAIRAWQPESLVADILFDQFRRLGMDSAVAAARKAVATADPRPWASRVQQLERFGLRVIRSGASGEDIYRSYRLATELYPESPAAWYALGRVYFGRRPKDAAEAFQRAGRLRPASDLIRRMAEASRRQ